VPTQHKREHRNTISAYVPIQRTVKAPSNQKMKD
jgi:hypothetical protein